MTRPSVTLHIGRGKTGTTGIRGFLSRNRKLLALRGIRYIYTGDEFEGGGHQDFAKSFIPTIPQWMEASPRLGTIQDEVSRELTQSTDEQYLLSSENFTLADPSRVRIFFERVLGPVRFKIIFFARSQDELAESQYNQDVKWSGETADFAAYIASNRLEELEFDSMLEPWVDTFGHSSIVARVYDAASASVIPDFLSCLSLAPDDWILDSAFDSLNKSVGYMATETFRLFNRFGLHGQRALYSQIDSLLQEHDLPALFFSSTEAREFRSRFGDSNRRFSQRFLTREIADLGGRRYSDAERDTLRARYAGTR